MPRYQFGDEIVNRKNLYMPCAIAADIDAMSEEEQARIYRATRWADNITNAEWPVVLGHDGVKAYVRSKLKRKGIGWLMALTRIARLNPGLFIEIVDGVDALYREQITERSGDESPICWDVIADECRERWLPTDSNEEAA